jgi:putative ABC transport system permease protein
MKLLRLIFQNILRNPLRSALTGIGTMMLVFVVTLVWSVLAFLDKQTTEKSANLKAIVSERWRLPSQMPYAYASTLIEGGARDDDDVRPLDYMTWTFYGGSIEKDPSKRSLDNFIFAFAMQPEKLLTMMDDLDSLPPDQHAAFSEVVQRLKESRNGLIVGADRLAGMSRAVGGQLKVGDRVTIYSVNYRGMDLEFEIVGLFPPGRYDLSAAINVDYFLASLDAYEQTNGKPHPLAPKALNLVWLKVPDRETFDKLADQIMTSPYYSNPAVKVETSSSGIAAFLESYRDLLWAARWLLAPAILLTLSLVIANAISISVRERETEFAVMKVLGFRPDHILSLVLGEAVCIGLIAGLASAGGTYWLINRVFGGLTLPIAFFGVFYIPIAAIWWGAAVGVGTALAGSLLPAWTARRVRVADVFARVT